MVPWAICFLFLHHALHFSESVVVRVTEFLNTDSKADMLIYSILRQSTTIYQTPCPSRAWKKHSKYRECGCMLQLSSA